MTENTRRRPARTSAVRRRKIGSGLETLETRVLMTGPTATARYYQPSVFPPRTVSHFSPALGLEHPIGSGARQLSFLDNDGKVVSGKDREGDEYVITVHGPGVVIVTDATPGDMMLDDDIATIQIVGADPHRTYVTGQVTASARVITDGQVNFNYLVSENGVKSIILNGFNLTNTVLPYPGQPFNVGPEIYLPGGVGTLQFNNIVTVQDEAAPDQPFEIVIGTPTNPIAQRPDIKIGSVFNTTVNSGLGFVPAGAPQVDPGVNFIINGQVHSLEMVSATRQPIPLPGFEINFPVVGSTGRTAIRAHGIDNLKVYGAARNLTASRAGTPFQPQTGQPGVPTPTPVTRPFQSAFSGLDHLGSAQFGGPTDGLGLDVDGPIGRLRFRRGLGDPTGTGGGEGYLGYNPANRGDFSYGLLGGLVTARSIRSLEAGPNNLILQTAQDPDFVQLLRQGTTRYYARPGNALTAAAITTDGDIGSVNIVGDALASEIKTGFNYRSYVAGLEGTRAPGAIRRYLQRGNLVDSVISASYRTTDNVYGDAANLDPLDPTVGADDVAGPGSITGQLIGTRVATGGQTALGNHGSGFYARFKRGHLPPPDRPTRIHSVAVRP